MIKNLIINVINNYINIAILENNKLVELHNNININKRIYVGDIYIGKIIYIYKGMNAVFLDIGYNKYGFLNYDDIGVNYLSLKNKKIIKIKNKKNNVVDIFKIGQYIIVQVVKDTIYNKGPKLTCKITLIGRFIILIPYSKKQFVSKKIKQKKIKVKLPYNFGCIIRTLAKKEKIKKNNIKLEIYILLKIWYKIFLKIKNKKIKKVYNNNNIFYNIFKRKTINYNNIICNNYKLCNEIRFYLYVLDKKKIKLIKYYKNKNISIFNKYGIDKQKEILFGKYIYLSDGSNLIIEQTEALNVIDINSNMINNYNAFKVNLLAIKEIVRQIRLRNMGGIIIIDLIDINKKKYKKKIYYAIKKEMKNDDIKHKILPPSKFNLIEITREKNSYFINKKKIKIKNKYIYFNIKRIENFLYNYYIIKKNRNRIYLYVHPFIATYLKYGFFSYRLKWYFKYNKWISISSIYSFNILEYKFLDIKNKCIFADVVE
ncbi:MAG: ribonuclease E/G [Candidatus Shikimatogenerans bostrichidophilus]|nr:MAG: ribonuclease E/G [Candidatus Shikimatogenerans bostrichidophilus]